MRVMSRPERERIEHDRLSSDAAFSDASSGRLVPEVPDPLRTCYQCDRDRILHSKSFRRMKATPTTASSILMPAAISRP